MVKRVQLTTFALLALLGCATPRPDGGEEELAGQLAGRTAGEPRNCVSATPGTGLTIVAPGAVGLRSGDTLWVNRLGRACFGMRPTDTLIVEAHGGRHCRGDRVRAASAGTSIAGPACILGDFIPYRSAG